MFLHCKPFFVRPLHCTLVPLPEFERVESDVGVTGSELALRGFRAGVAEPDTSRRDAFSGTEAGAGKGFDFRGAMDGGRLPGRGALGEVGDEMGMGSECGR